MVASNEVDVWGKIADTMLRTHITTFRLITEELDRKGIKWEAFGPVVEAIKTEKRTFQACLSNYNIRKLFNKYKKSGPDWFCGYIILPEGESWVAIDGVTYSKEEAPVKERYHV